MSESERRGSEPIEDRPGTESEGGSNTAATPPISDEDQKKDSTQRPPESDDAGVGETGTEDPHP